MHIDRNSMLLNTKAYGNFTPIVYQLMYFVTFISSNIHKPNKFQSTKMEKKKNHQPQISSQYNPSPRLKTLQEEEYVHPGFKPNPTTKTKLLYI